MSGEKLRKPEQNRRINAAFFQIFDNFPDIGGEIVVFGGADNGGFLVGFASRDRLCANAIEQIQRLGGVGGHVAEWAIDRCSACDRALLAGRTPAHTVCSCGIEVAHIGERTPRTGWRRPGVVEVDGGIEIGVAFTRLESLLERQTEVAAHVFVVAQRSMFAELRLESKIHLSAEKRLGEVGAGPARACRIGVENVGLQRLEIQPEGREVVALLVFDESEIVAGRGGDRRVEIDEWGVFIGKPQVSGDLQSCNQNKVD